MPLVRDLSQADWALLRISSMGKTLDSGSYKYLVAIGLIALTVVLLVFLFYFYNFSAPLSNSQQIWGEFGDFIGGTLNPILSFLALIALLMTITLQSKQLFFSRQELELTKMELAKTADAAQKQVQHFENEAIRADLYKIIQKLSDRVNRNYNENRLDAPPTHTSPLSIHYVLKRGANINKNSTLRFMYDKWLEHQSDTHKTLIWLNNDLDRLSKYIKEYENFSDSAQRPFTEFFRDEHGEMVKVLYELGIFPKSLYDFYSGTR